jgi:hypothetical protein
LLLIVTHAIGVLVAGIAAVFEELYDHLRQSDGGSGGIQDLGID